MTVWNFDLITREDKYTSTTEDLQEAFTALYARVAYHPQNTFGRLNCMWVNNQVHFVIYGGMKGYFAAPRTVGIIYPDTMNNEALSELDRNRNEMFLIAKQTVGSGVLFKGV